MRVSVFVVLMAIASLMAFGHYVLRMQTFSVDYVSIRGDLNALQKEEVYQILLALEPAKSGIVQIKQALESESWIHQAEVTRRWPDRLTITVYEERPIAYWNDDAFISREGHVFNSPHLEPSELAQLYGPKGSEQEVMQQYLMLGTTLSRSGQIVDTLVLDERGSWMFTTASGIQVLLGRDDIKQRMQRLQDVIDSEAVASRLELIKQIDTRYSNGVAVGWKDAANGLDVAITENMQRELKL